MENKILEHPEIKGWAVDANEKNDPTYPIKHRTNEEHKGYNWERPVQQPIIDKVFHSNERINITAVYGTSVQPSGLSGLIRKFAFRYGESSYGHWIPLIIADRINVIEGIMDDLSRGYLPNIFAERGFRASWKYNKKGVFKSLAKRMVIPAAVLAIVFRKSLFKKIQKVI
ncbi:MAG: hypothetical protein ACK40G_16305 [Cytophagaceae bacterium]